MRLLDEMGMRDRDGDGWREAPGGEPFVMDMNVGTSSVLGTMGFATSELVRDYWQEVGVKVNYKQIADELAKQLRNSNSLDLYTWVAGSYLSTRLVLPQNFGTSYSGLRQSLHGLARASTLGRGRQTGRRATPGPCAAAPSGSATSRPATTGSKRRATPSSTASAERCGRSTRSCCP